MLRRASLWHGLTTYFVVSQLAAVGRHDGPPPESNLRALV
jgi:hypothetical protein